MKEYTIDEYSYKQAERYGVKIEKSKNPRKLIDVYKKDEFVCSIGSKQHKNGIDIMKREDINGFEKYALIRKWKNRHKIINTDEKFYTYHLLY